MFDDGKMSTYTIVITTWVGPDCPGTGAGSAFVTEKTSVSGSLASTCSPNLQRAVQTCEGSVSLEITEEVSYIKPLRDAQAWE